MATHELADLFGERQTEELEAVIIAAPKATGGTTGSISSPIPWTDYEEIVVGGGAGDGILYNTASVVKEFISLSPSSWNVQVRFSDANTTVATVVTATGANTATISGNPAKFVIGYKKKYATTNLSTEVQVNGGNDIAVNSRYEIAASELPASFLNADGTIKKNVEVKAEIFNNSGIGVADWGESGQYAPDPSAVRFVKATIVGNNIVVQTGTTGLTTTSSQSGNGFGINVNIVSTACKVIATLAGEAYTVQTA